MMFKLLIISLLAVGAYNVQDLEVIDGDTMRVTIRVWPDVYIKQNLRVRGLNTPEKRTRRTCEKIAAEAATQYAIHHLTASSAIVEIKNVEHGKFAGRFVADLYVNGRNYTQMVLEAGLGMPYVGGKREPWPCKDK